jgi:hypothetical protein
VLGIWSLEFPYGWLSGMDSNHDKSLQRALCYHYTTGQTSLNLAFGSRRRKAKVSPEKLSGLNVLADKHQIGRLPCGNARLEVSAHASQCSQARKDVARTGFGRVLKTQVDPGRWTIFFEPGHLPFCKLPGANFDQLDCLG